MCEIVFYFVVPQEQITIYDYIFSKLLIVNFCLRPIKPTNVNFKFLRRFQQLHVSAYGALVI